MRKSVSVIAVTLGLAFAGTLPAAADGPPIATSTCPTTSYVDAGPYIELTRQVAALEAQNRSLAFDLNGAQWRLHRKYHKIRRQAREIRHLRAQLAAKG